MKFTLAITLLVVAFVLWISYFAEVPPDTKHKPVQLTLQDKFCRVISSTRNEYLKVLDGPKVGRTVKLQQVAASLRRQLTELMPNDRAVTDWQGKLYSVYENAQNLSVIFEIILPCRVRLQTVKPVLPGLSAHQGLIGVEKGTHIIFSGQFLSPARANRTFKEFSITDVGWMREPEYIFLFKTIRK